MKTSNPNGDPQVRFGNVLSGVFLHISVGTDRFQILRSENFQSNLSCLKLDFMFKGTMSMDILLVFSRPPSKGHLTYT